MGIAVAITKDGKKRKRWLNRTSKLRRFIAETEDFGKNK